MTARLVDRLRAHLLRKAFGASFGASNRPVNTGAKGTRGTTLGFLTRDRVSTTAAGQRNGLSVRTLGNLGLGDNRAASRLSFVLRGMRDRERARACSDRVSGALLARPFLLAIVGVYTG